MCVRQRETERQRAYAGPEKIEHYREAVGLQTIEQETKPFVSSPLRAHGDG